MEIGEYQADWVGDDDRPRYIPRDTEPGLRNLDEVRNLLGDHYDADVTLDPDGAPARYKVALMAAVIERLRDTAAAHGVRLHRGQPLRPARHLRRERQLSAELRRRGPVLLLVQRRR